MSAITWLHGPCVLVPVRQSQYFPCCYACRRGSAGNRSHTPSSYVLQYEKVPKLLFCNRLEGREDTAVQVSLLIFATVVVVWFLRYSISSSVRTVRNQVQNQEQGDLMRSSTSQAHLLHHVIERHSARPERLVRCTLPSEIKSDVVRARCLLSPHKNLRSRVARVLVCSFVDVSIISEK